VDDDGCYTGACEPVICPDPPKCPFDHSVEDENGCVIGIHLIPPCSASSPVVDADGCYTGACEPVPVLEPDCPVEKCPFEHSWKDEKGCVIGIRTIPFCSASSPVVDDDGCYTGACEPVICPDPPKCPFDHSVEDENGCVIGIHLIPPCSASSPVVDADGCYTGACEPVPVLEVKH